MDYSPTGPMTMKRRNEADDDEIQVNRSCELGDGWADVGPLHGKPNEGIQRRSISMDHLSSKVSTLVETCAEQEDSETVSITDGIKSKRGARSMQSKEPNSAPQSSSLPKLVSVAAISPEMNLTGEGLGVQAKMPLEILQMIMSHLEDTTDLQNCSRADPSLDDLLIKRKPEYLFSLVLPHVIKRLPEPSIIKCRLVCKSWKTGVDEAIQNRPAIRPYDDRFFLGEMKRLGARLNKGFSSYAAFNPTVVLRSTIHSMDAFQADYDKLNFGGRSPFIGGSVEVVVETEEILIEEDMLANPHLQRLRAFLESFGHHIQYLRLRNREDDDHHEMFSLMVYLIFMKLCPNLKSSEMWGAWDFPSEQSQELLALVSNVPITLPHLHILELIQPAFTSQVVTNFVLSPCLHQLRKLTVSHWTDELDSHLPNLTDLRVVCIDSNTILERLGRITAPVEKLSLSFRYRNLNMDILQRVLNRFPVRHLELNWISDGRPMVPKTRPPLAVFKISTVHTLVTSHSPDVNYSFLRWFPNLRYLFLRERIANDRPGPLSLSLLSARVMKRIAGHEVVQIHKFLYSKEMNRSNIWDLFQNLITVAFEREREANLEEIQMMRHDDPVFVEKLKVTWEKNSRLIHMRTT